MNSLIASFINNKKKEEDIKTSNLIMEIESHSVNKKVTLAKAAQLLNSLQTLRVADHLVEFTERLENPIKEVGFKFKDSSILVNQSGRLSGLNESESALWEKGIYFKSKIEIPITNEDNNSKLAKETQKTLKLSL